MTYVLRERVNNRYYCKDHDKIIEFSDIQTAHNFLAGFSQYAMTMAMQTNPFMIGEIQSLINSTTVDEKPNSGFCEYITYEDILKSKGVY